MTGSTNKPITKYKIKITIILFLQYYITCTISKTQPSTKSNLPHNQPPKKSKKQVILLDVDNTLYTDEVLSIPIEKQIVENTYKFCKEECNISSLECDALYIKHGTTVDGLRDFYKDNEDGNNENDALVASFYEQVYHDINIHSLLSSSNTNNKNPNQREDTKDEDGYNFNNDQQHNDNLYNTLQKMSQTKNTNVYITSNSPKYHIKRILSALGLVTIPWKGIVTPDSIRSNDDATSLPALSTSTTTCNEEKKVLFPTKSSFPASYYDSILKQHVTTNDNEDANDSITLVDDSIKNIKMAQSLGIHGIHIDNNNHNKQSLPNVLTDSFLQTPQNNPFEQYTFHEVEYLRRKNRVDEASININVWNRFQSELSLIFEDKTKDSKQIVIADVGAGILSFFHLFFYGSSSSDVRLQSMKIPSTCKGITYIAYESNVNLVPACHDLLLSKGFQLVPQQDDNEYEDELYPKDRIYKGVIQSKKITVHLRTYDFQTQPQPQEIKPDAIVGCCFADLFSNSRALLSNLLSHFQYNYNHEMLLYFPITYTGSTILNPSYPATKTTPSDTTVVQAYAHVLREVHGHQLDVQSIIAAVRDYGGVLLEQEKSNWVIEYERDEYLWYTILYFICTSGTFDYIRERQAEYYEDMDIAQELWVDRMMEGRSSIIASNHDLLFRFHAIPNELECSNDSSSTIHKKKEESNTNNNKKTIQEILFVSPRKVSMVERKWLHQHETQKQLKPNEIEIEALYSLISSGTELKVFQGNFEAATQLDVNIQSLKDESMSYPLKYGYSLVGKIIRCGSEVVDADDILHKLIFSFSPHESRLIVDREDVQMVPDGIAAEDAIFMPSMETAISITHDANIRLGEHVAIFGQGLIGLLVTLLLREQVVGHRLTVFDALLDRLMVSSSLGVSEALLPTQIKAVTSQQTLFDVAIEVSGNPHALQSAIDSTVTNGRIIIASWYGHVNVPLKLGMEFHRSHKTLITSQVSTIPAALSGLWDKERRFKLTWEMIRLFRPSRFLGKIVSLGDAQSAYECLERGDVLAIAFKYD